MNKLVINTDDFLPGDEGVDEADEGVSDEGMPDDAEATPDDASGEMPEGEKTDAGKPAAPPKGYVPAKDLDNLRSTYDRQVAEARRQNEATLNELQTLKSELDKRDERMLALETRDMTEEEAAVVRERYDIAKERRETLIEKQRVAAERASLIAERAEAVRADYAAKFATQYGVPKQILLDAPTSGPQDMEALARAYSAGRRSAAGESRREAGTDKLDSGTPARGGLGSFRDIERAYAQGKISEAVYEKARKARGID